jgi:pRiA4b ORF-3-like protein
MSLHEPNAVQIRGALVEIEPPIWRRVVVPIRFHLGQLHRVIQAAFGCWDCHLHEFRIAGLSYRDAEVCDPEFEGDARNFDESTVRLLDFDRREHFRFLYVYDFGDDRKHVIEFERLLAPDPKPRKASCIAKARSCV